MSERDAVMRGLPVGESPARDIRFGNAVGVILICDVVTCGIRICDVVACDIRL